MNFIGGCMTIILKSRWLMIAVVCCFSLLITAPQLCSAKTLAKVSLSAEGASTGLPDLFTGTMSYSIPIEVPAGRKGMDPGLALSYRSGNGNGLIGVGWELEVGSIQHSLSSNGTVDYTQNNYLLTRSGSSSTLVSVGNNEYKEKIEGGFSRIQQITADDGKPCWVVTDKTGIRFFYGQSAASRQDGNGSNIFKWCLNKIVDRDGNYIAIYYYKDYCQIYLDRIEYTGNSGLVPTNYVNFYWEPRVSDILYDTNTTVVGFPVTTRYRLATIDIVAKPTSTTSVRIKTYKLTYDNSSLTITNGSMLRSVQQFDKNAQVPPKSLGYGGIASSGQVTGGTSLPAKTMSYNQTSGVAYADYLSSYSNGIGGTTSIIYTTAPLSGTTDPTDIVPIVSSVTVNDGNDKNSTTDYKYDGGYYFEPEKDFRGFNKVTVQRPVSDDGKQVSATTYFHQGNDTAVIPENASVADLNALANVSTGYMKGKPYRTRLTDSNSNGNKYSESTTIYSPDATSPYFNPPLQIDSYVYDGDSSYKQTKTIYAYDVYGNVNREDHYGDVSDIRDDRTVVRTFLPNIVNWIVGLPATEDIYQGIGTTNKVAGKVYYYDDLSTCSAGPTNNQTPVYGKLTGVESYLSGGTNPVVRMTYNSLGNPICQRDAKGNITSIAYDASNTFPTIVTNPLGQQSVTQYYGVDGVLADTGLYGQVKSSTDPNGASTTVIYDAFGRKTKETLPDGTWASLSYNNFGTVGSQHVRTVNSAGLWKASFFDGLGRTIKEKSSGPDNKTIVVDTVYNATGTVKQASLPYFDVLETSRNMTYVYDLLGRVTQADNPDATFALACYNDGVTVKIDAKSHRKREVRDALGRLVKVQEYTGSFSTCTTDETAVTTVNIVSPPYATTYYIYDVLGNLRYVLDEKSSVTEMRYDTLGRKYYMKDPDMGVWGYTYDANGNLQTQTDAKGQIITFGYDALNRLKTKKNGASLVMTNYYDEDALGYYNKGRLTRMTDLTGQTISNYDNVGRIISSRRTVSGVPYPPFYYSYTNGRLNSITYPGNETVTYSYNGDNLASVGGYATYSGFNALGQPGTVTFGNGVATTYGYYDTTNNRLKTIATAKGGTPLLSLLYGYDNVGNISGISNLLNNTRSQSFDYDELNRLTKSVNSVYGTRINSYDQIGNILTKDGISYGYGTKPHAVTSVNGGLVYLYDANGNVFSDSLRGTTYGYDYDNMPTSTGNVSFTYDGTGTRVKKSTPSSTTVYVDKMYECTNGVCAKYIFAGSTRLARNSNGIVHYYHPDHLGSTIIVTDAAGAVAEDITYYPFGTSRQDSGTVSLSHKFTGQEKDSETGLYNYNARLYDADFGRFLTPDSIVPDPTNPQSLNRYSYVLNNPLLYSDPSGHSFWNKAFGVAEIIGGFATIYYAPPELKFIGAISIGDGVDRLGGDSDVPPSSTIPIANYGGGSGSSSSSGAGVEIGNTGVRFVGLGEILAIDSYALFIGQASHLYTFPMDLYNVGTSLYQGNLGAAGAGLVKTALDLVVPRYGNAGGSGWGISENRQGVWEHTLGQSFDFALNRADQPNFSHDDHGDDWRWIRDQLSVGGSGRATGPFGFAYKMIGTVGFGLTGLRPSQFK